MLLTLRLAELRTLPASRPFVLLDEPLLLALLAGEVGIAAARPCCPPSGIRVENRALRAQAGWDPRSMTRSLERVRARPFFKPNCRVPAPALQYKPMYDDL